MEFTCLVAGDAVAEPGAVVLALLQRDLLAEQMAALAQLPSEAESSSSASAMAVRLEGMDAEQLQNVTEYCLSSPHPSLPSVTLSLRFVYVTDPSKLAVLAQQAHFCVSVIVVVFSACAAPAWAFQRLQDVWVPAVAAYVQSAAAAGTGMGRAGITPSVLLASSRVDLYGACQASRVLQASSSVRGDNSGLLPPAADVAAACQRLGAKDYFELALLSSDNDGARHIRTQVEQLKMRIVEACVGELVARPERITAAAVEQQQERSKQLFARPRSEAVTPTPPLLPDAAGGAVGRLTGAVTKPSNPMSTWTWKRNPKNERVFFVNRVTRKAQYKRPDDYDGDEPEWTMEEAIQLAQEKQAELEKTMALEKQHNDLLASQLDLQEHEGRMKVKEAHANRLNAETLRLREQKSLLEQQHAANVETKGKLQLLREEICQREADFLQEELLRSATIAKERHEIEHQVQLLKEEPVTESGMDTESLQKAIDAVLDNCHQLTISIRRAMEKGMTVREEGADTHTRYVLAQQAVQRLLAQESELEVEGVDLQIQLNGTRRELQVLEEARIRVAEQRLQELRQVAARRAEKLVEAQTRIDFLLIEMQRLTLLVECEVHESDLAPRHWREHDVETGAVCAAAGERREWERLSLQLSQTTRVYSSAVARWAFYAWRAESAIERIGAHLRDLAGLRVRARVVLEKYEGECASRRAPLMHRWYQLDANQDGGPADDRRQAEREVPSSRVVREMEQLSARMTELDEELDRTRRFRAFFSRKLERHIREATVATQPLLDWVDELLAPDFGRVQQASGRRPVVCCGSWAKRAAPAAAKLLDQFVDVTNEVGDGGSTRGADPTGGFAEQLDTCIRRMAQRAANDAVDPVRCGLPTALSLLAKGCAAELVSLMPPAPLQRALEVGRDLQAAARSWQKKLDFDGGAERSTEVDTAAEQQNQHSMSGVALQLYRQILDAFPLSGQDAGGERATLLESERQLRCMGRRVEASRAKYAAVARSLETQIGLRH